MGEPRRRLLFRKAETRGDGVERVGEIAPRRARARGGRESAHRWLPMAVGRLRGGDLVRAHPVKIIVGAIMLADMVEAQQPPAAGAVEIGRLDRRLKLARLAAAGDGAAIGGALDATVEFWITRCHSPSLAGRHLLPLPQLRSRPI